MPTNQNSSYSGIKSSEVNKIGAYHMIGDDSYEPQRNNNFEMHIYGLNNLFTVDDNRRIIPSVAEETLILSTVSVGEIATDVGIIEIPYGNTKVKFAGLPSFSNADIVHNDYIGKATERIIAAWHGVVFNPNTEKIGRATEYKKLALLIETAPDGSSAREWRLEGVWPKSVRYGNYSYDGNGTVRQITMTLAYDRAIPVDN